MTYAKQGDLGDSGHIVVFRQNRPWKVDTAKDGRILSTAELERSAPLTPVPHRTDDPNGASRQFQYIYDHTTHEYPGVGVLSASNRDVWAKVRVNRFSHAIRSLTAFFAQDYAELLASPQNAHIIETIQSAAFTVSLDASSPTGFVGFSRSLWHGDVQPSQGPSTPSPQSLPPHLPSGIQVPTGLRNRWVDKPVQFIVYDNAQAGIMGEHSVMDGTPTARMCDDILGWLYDPSFDHGSPPPSSAAAAAPPAPLDWHISPTTQSAIATADQAALALIDSQALGFHRTAYGKAAIKRFGVSPDAWAQMTIQLAYRRLLAAQSETRRGATYEAATTRRFFKGRTEAIRVVSAESDRWVASMDDPAVDKAARKTLFLDAAKKHLGLARESGNAIGIDRLMLGESASSKRFSW